jgi:hypothetical protein
VVRRLNRPGVSFASSNQRQDDLKRFVVNGETIAEIKNFDLEK